MRTFLFLINGLGVEAKNSYSIYDASLMPNFDMLTKKHVFSTLTSNVKNITDGFRNMSLEISELYNYHIFEREALANHILNNNTYLSIQNEIVNRKSNLHLFVFIDTSMKVLDNLKSFLKLINKDHDKNIYIHIVLTSTNYEDYPLILEVLSKINIDLGEDAKIGMVLGLETLLNSNPVTELNFFLKIFVSEIGERWQSFKQKLDVSYGTKKSPSSMKPFVVNNGFALKNNDICMIWNYDNIDITNFINGVKTINYGQGNLNNIIFYSLFPITSKDGIPYILNYETSNVSLASNMKGLNFKSLVLTNNDSVNALNYYLNGMNFINNPDISYIAIDNSMYDANIVINTINSKKEDFVIMNYDITNVKSIEELKNVLKNIDNIIGNLYSYCQSNNCSMIISSLYGMNKILPNNKGEICHVIYGKVPIIYIDSFITKSKYLISDGTITDLFKVCYKTINRKYPGETIVVKKNFLYRLIFR